MGRRLPTFPEDVVPLPSEPAGAAEPPPPPPAPTGQIGMSEWLAGARRVDVHEAAHARQQREEYLSARATEIQRRLASVREENARLGGGARRVNTHRTDSPEERRGREPVSDLPTVLSLLRQGISRLGSISSDLPPAASSSSSSTWAAPLLRPPSRLPSRRTEEGPGGSAGVGEAQTESIPIAILASPRPTSRIPASRLPPPSSLRIRPAHSLFSGEQPLIFGSQPSTTTSSTSIHFPPLTAPLASAVPEAASTSSATSPVRALNTQLSGRIERLASLRERINASAAAGRTGETDSLIRSAREALQVAVGYSEILEETARFLSRAADTATPVDRAPTRAEGPSSPQTTDPRPYPASALFSLHRSIDQLRAASAQIDQVLGNDFSPAALDALYPLSPPRTHHQHSSSSSSPSEPAPLSSPLTALFDSTTTTATTTRTTARPLRAFSARTSRPPSFSGANNPATSTLGSGSSPYRPFAPVSSRVASETAAGGGASRRAARNVSALAFAAGEVGGATGGTTWDGEGEEVEEEKAEEGEGEDKVPWRASWGYRLDRNGDPIESEDEEAEEKARIRRRDLVGR